MKWEICAANCWDDAKQLAADGWELVGITAITTEDHKGCEHTDEWFYFKRPLAPAQAPK